MKRIFLLLSLAIAGLGAKGQPTFQERAYRLDNKLKLMSTSDQDRQGNVIMSGLINTGISSGNGGSFHRSVIMLLKPNTDTLWTRNGPEIPDSFYYPGVKFRTNGGYSFATSIRKTIIIPTPPDDFDGVLQHYSPGGDLLLNKTINPKTNNNGIISFLTMPDKGYLINGWDRTGTSPGVITLTRTDSAGTVLWQRNHTKVAPSGLAYMEHAGNGRVILAGNNQSSSTVNNRSKIKLFLIDANGDSLREVQLNMTDPTREEIMYGGGTENCVISLADGGFLITGVVDTINQSAGIGTSLGFVARVNASLQLVWKHFDRPQSINNITYFTKAKELKDGSIIVVGQNNQGNMFQLYRFNAFGALINTYPFTSTLYPSLQVNVLEALPDSSLMIGGRCRTAGNAQAGFYVAKVKIPGLAAGRPSYIMAAPKEVTVPANALGAAYPNPAREQVYIPYQLPSGFRSASIRLTDITGKEVGSYSLKQERQGQLPVNISKLPNGLYLYSLLLDGRPVATKKLSVQH